MSFEHLSFIDIFEEKKINNQNEIVINGQNLTVEIPMLQRDYAYGRLSESTTEKRRTFLRSIKGYLDSDIKNHELDFIYGSTKDINGEKILILLDGQQRITTLFLLHWYLAKCSSNEIYEQFKSLLMENGVSRFRYATRDSSTAFCNALIKNGNCKGLCFLDEKDNIINNKVSISSRIKDEKWFFDHWANDPTVINMLNMLDDIEKYFPKKIVKSERYFEKLNKSGKESSITFNFLPFDEYGLTDELYIKMNSRGKPLTRFENLKSKILKSLDYLKDTNRSKNILADVNKVKEGKPYDSLREYVSRMIDTKWTDVFWNYWFQTKGDISKRYPKEKDIDYPCIDDMMLAFISNFCIYYEIIRIAGADFSISKGSEENKEIESLMSLRNQISYDDMILMLITEKNTHDLLKTFDDQKTLDLIKSMKTASDYDCILFDLIIVLDELSENIDKKWNLKSFFNNNELSNYSEEKDFNIIVYEFKEKKESNRHYYDNKFRYFGFINYLLAYKSQINKSHFDEWMLFVNNLTNNSYLLSNSSFNFATCIIGLNKLLSEDIYKSIKTKDQLISQIVTLDQNQLCEEKLKGFLFDNLTWKTSIIDATQKLSYFEGHLYYPLINLCKISPNDLNNSDSIDSFNTVVEKLKAVFPDKKGCNVENELIRALLSVGDYTIQIGNVKTYSLFQNDGRDISWRRLIKNQDSRTDMFTSVITDSLFNKGDVKNSFIKIADKNKPNVKDNWRRLIIENPDMINYLGPNRYLRWNETNKKHQNSESNWDNWEIDLLNKTVIFGKHYEIFTYALNNKLSSKMSQLSPFAKKEFIESKTENHETEIKLYGWKENSGTYYMYIRYADNDQYKVTFTYYENDNEEIPNQKIKDVLDNYGYTETDTIYSNLLDEKDIVQHLIDLSKDFVMTK